LFIDSNWEISYSLGMGRSMTQKQKELHYHTWEDNEERGVYKLRNYNMHYITITRWMPGEKDPVTTEVYDKIQYIPTINGFRLNNRGSHVCENTKWKFDNLEEAKNGAKLQIDKNFEAAKGIRYVRIAKDT
jgi:hypothetical protein